MSVNSRLKATKILGQRKAFCRQRISESSCAGKETIDIDIVVTSRNGILSSLLWQNKKLLQVRLPTTI